MPVSPTKRFKVDSTESSEKADSARSFAMSQVDDLEFFTVFKFNGQAAADQNKQELDDIFSICKDVPNCLYDDAYLDLMKCVTVYGFPNAETLERARSEFISSVFRTVNFYFAKKREKKPGKLTTRFEEAVD